MKIKFFTHTYHAGMSREWEINDALMDFQTLETELACVARRVR